MPVSPQKDAFVNKIWFSCFLANWVSTGLSRRQGGQGGLGAFSAGKGRGECTTGAYTAWKIFEARPAPGTRQARPPLPAMCRPRRCCRGATTAGGGLGDFVSGGFGLQGVMCVWSSAPGPIPATSQIHSWVGCHSVQVGDLPPRSHWWPISGEQSGVVWVWECGRSPPGCWH